MPTFAEICAYLDTLFPPSLAEPWDRDGPAVDPCPAREVTAAVVALDVTSPAIEYAIAIGAQCIVTHHPLLFKLPDALRALWMCLLESMCSVMGFHFCSSTGSSAAKRKGRNG